MSNRLLGCVAAAIFAMGSLAFAEPPKPKFQMGKDTTFITEPLDADGYLDFETALNERLRGKITPETNAVVLLWQAMGPKPFGKAMHADFYKWLGTKPPPEKGEYFVSIADLLRDSGENQPEGEFYKADSQLSKRPWSAKEHPECVVWLERNEKPLALVVRAISRKDYFYPLVSRTEKGERGFLLSYSLGGSQYCRNFADAIAKRAMLKAFDGNFDEAWQDILTIHRLGRQVARGGTLMEYLIGSAINTKATQANLAFLERAKPDAKRAMQYLKDIQELPPMPAICEKITVTERFVFLDTMQMMRKGGPDKLPGNSKPKESDVELLAKQQKAFEALDWESMFRMGHLWYDRLGKALLLPTHLERDTAIKKVEDDLRTQRKNLGDTGDLKSSIEDGDVEKVGKAVSERLGMVSVRLLLPATKVLNTSVARTEQSHQNLQLAFALAAYRADNGKYPATLDLLAPKYLAKIPGDLFNDKPLIYKPNATGYILYSVGENGKDDNGVSATDDIVVRVPNP